MNPIAKLKAANAAALAIIQGFVSGAADTPDAVALRTEELKAMKKDELIAIVLGLEKPKVEGGVKIESVARAILESPACAPLTYEQIAGMITGALPEAKTSSKSIASYVSKHKDGENAWTVVGREKIRFDMNTLIGMAVSAEPDKAAVNQ